MGELVPTMLRGRGPRVRPLRASMRVARTASGVVDGYARRGTRRRGPAGASAVQHVGVDGQVGSSEPGTSRGVDADDPGSPHAAHVRHLAVIMDGNHRWAVERGVRAEAGYEQGVESLRTLIDCSLRRGVEALTVFAYSKDNGKRGVAESAFLFRLFESCLEAELANLVDAGVWVHFIGARGSLPPQLQRLMRSAERASSPSDGAAQPRMHLTIALNYSAREDMASAARSLAREAVAATLRAEDIDEDAFERRLSTSVLPKRLRQPDLLLRTSGEERLSDFLLWEVAYSELVFTHVKWPEFGSDDFDAAMDAFATRERRFGGR